MLPASLPRGLVSENPPVGPTHGFQHSSVCVADTCPRPVPGLLVLSVSVLRNHEGSFPIDESRQILRGDGLSVPFMTTLVLRRLGDHPRWTSSVQSLSAPVEGFTDLQFFARERKKSTL